MQKFDLTPGRSLRIQKACRVNCFEENRLRRQINLFEKEKMHNLRLTNQNIYTLNRTLGFIRTSSGYSPEGLPPDQEQSNYEKESIGSCFLYGERQISRRFGKFRRATSAGNRRIIPRPCRPEIPARPQSCPITRNDHPKWEDVLDRVQKEKVQSDEKEDKIVVEVPDELIKIRSNSVTNCGSNSDETQSKLTRKNSVVRFSNGDDKSTVNDDKEKDEHSNEKTENETVSGEAERCRTPNSTRRRSSAKILTRRKSKPNVTARYEQETLNRRKSVVETGEWDSLLKEEKEIFEGPDDILDEDGATVIRPLEERRASRIRRGLPSNDPQKNDFVHTVNQARVLATNVCRRRSSCITEQFEIRTISDKNIDKVITLKLELTAKYKEALERAQEFEVSSSNLKQFQLEPIQEPKPITTLT